MNTKRLAIIVLVIFASITANIVLHEAGHFVVADALELNPEMHFESPVNISDGVVVTTPNFAYVSYSSPTSSINLQDAVIAVSGPLVNAMLALLATALYIFYPNKSRVVKYSLLIFLTISVTSLIVNLIPVTPSDGSILLKYIL